MEETAPKLTWKGRLIALGVGVILTLVVAEGVIRITMPHWQDFYSARFMRAIMVPGYGVVSTGVPNFDGYFAQNNGDFRVQLKINNFGLRNPEPVTEAGNRIWIIGDSMAFGWGVEQNEMYSSVLGKKLKSKTYNVASPGTNVCGYQTLLSRMPKNLVPTSVVIGLILENDISDRNCKNYAQEREKKWKSGEVVGSAPLSWIAFKRYLTGKSALYNFGVVGLKRIDFVRDLFTKIGLIRKPISYKGFISNDNFKIGVTSTANKLDVLRKMLPEGTPFSVLIAPGRFELLNDDKFYRQLRLAVITELKKRNIRFVDPFNRFKKAGYKNIHFAHDGHWTALGHKIAAEEIAKVLKSNN
jgi:hypothetical protein